MKNSINTITVISILLFSVSSFAANKAVVIPLNSSSPVYVAGIEITALPYEITSSGFYFITNNLIGAPGDHGITISVNNVTLDLMGFSLSGPRSTGPYDGIYMEGRSNVEIRNGTVRGFPRDGIREILSSGKSHRVINIRAMDNDGRGIFLLSMNNTVEGCTASGNGQDGILARNGSTVNGNTAFNNDSYGINVSAGSTVSGNTAYDNTWDGLEVGLGSTVSGNTAYHNDGDGISVSAGSTVSGNTTYLNSNGISVGDGSTVSNNTSRSNSAYGIILVGGHNLVIQNTVTDNSSGNIKSCGTCTLVNNHAP